LKVAEIPNLVISMRSGMVQSLSALNPQTIIRKPPAVAKAFEDTNDIFKPILFKRYPERTVAKKSLALEE